MGNQGTPLLNNEPGTLKEQAGTKVHVSFPFI